MAERINSLGRIVDDKGHYVATTPLLRSLRDHNLEVGEHLDMPIEDADNMTMNGVQAIERHYGRYYATKRLGVIRRIWRVK